MKIFRVVRTFPRGYCHITTEDLSEAFEKGWQFVDVHNIGKEGCLEYILSKEEQGFR